MVRTDYLPERVPAATKCAQFKLFAHEVLCGRALRGNHKTARAGLGARFAVRVGGCTACFDHELVAGAFLMIPQMHGAHGGGSEQAPWAGRAYGRIGHSVNICPGCMLHRGNQHTRTPHTAWMPIRDTMPVAMPNHVSSGKLHMGAYLAVGACNVGQWCARLAQELRLGAHRERGAVVLRGTVLARRFCPLARPTLLAIFAFGVGFVGAGRGCVLADHAFGARCAGFFKAALTEGTSDACCTDGLGAGAARRLHILALEAVTTTTSINLQADKSVRIHMCHVVIKGQATRVMALVVCCPRERSARAAAAATMCDAGTHWRRVSQTRWNHQTSLSRS